jgi:hypothetical protein
MLCRLRMTESKTSVFALFRTTRTYQRELCWLLSDCIQKRVDE